MRWFALLRLIVLSAAACGADMFRRPAGRRLLLASLAVLVSLPAAGADSASRQSGAVDVLRQPKVIRIDGAAANDDAGALVAGAGDVNGDGRADMLVGAWFHDNARSNRGAAYVVFGRASATSIDLAALGVRGYRIDGAVDTEYGFSVAGAGDVNGDGRADVLVGATGVDNNGRRNSGSTWVVFGKSDAATVDLAALGARGFRIDGASSFEFAGASVAGAGDVNADGRADVLVGAPGAGDTGSGSAYVVFGKSDSVSVDLAALDERGFRMDGRAAPSPSGIGDEAGSSVAGAGDVNGDGHADVLVGAAGASNNGRDESGSTYVVFGPASTATIDLTALGARGFRIDGAADADGIGASSVAADDVNGDGRADVLVGASGAGDKDGVLNPGAAYVVFGKSDTASVDLAALGPRGFRIDGAAREEGGAGWSVAGAGDLNKDGRADVVMGAPGVSNNRRMYSGSAYVVFGKTGTATIDLAALGARGFRIDGAATFDNAGSAVAGAGDVSADGWVDVLVGADGASNNGRKHSGSAYVVFGRREATNVDLAAATDTAAPQLVLGGPRSQRALRQKGVVVSASCNEACKLRASGTVALSRPRIVLPLRPAGAALAGARKRTLRLALSERTLARLQHALRQGYRAWANVTVRAVDPAGNASSAKRTFRLTP